MTKQRVEVFLGLGSNIDPYASLRAGLGTLQASFGALVCSSVYESEAVGFSGPPFLNMALKMETALSLRNLFAELREIEYRFGRPLSATPFSSRRLDIDILLYGDYVGKYDDIALPRPEILYSPYVLVPLSDLIPKWNHPVAELHLKNLVACSSSLEKVRKVTFDYSLEVSSSTAQTECILHLLPSP